MSPITSDSTVLPFEIVAEPLPGGPLGQLVMRGSLPDAWGVNRPADAAAWLRHIRTAREAAPEGWWHSLRGALGAESAAAPRLASVADGRGIVVTTGQQPGLFGGPLYTLYKALSALALADMIRDQLGVPAAPVFWAATEDSDFAEARWTGIALRGGARLLSAEEAPADGTPMSLAPLGDIRSATELLRSACGSQADSDALQKTELAYRTNATHGTAYVQLLRAVLEPLGVAVLDASHAEVRSAADRILRLALTSGDDVAAAIGERDAELRAMGMAPQVNDVPGLSLVFVHEGGKRRRVSLKEAAAVARSGAQLSPNVLLRPVLERAILPTAAYVGGAAELAYFAQSAAVARALDLAPPLGVPRWSGTIVEQHISRILSRHELFREELASPHEAWGKVARRGVPDAVLREIEKLKTGSEESFRRLESLMLGGDRPLFDGPEVVKGANATVQHRIARFERRVIAAAKRRDLQLADDFATARGALYPLGKRQERALGFIPFLAKYGDDFIAAVRSAAAAHATSIISGSQPAGEGAPQMSAGSVSASG